MHEHGIVQSLLHGIETTAQAEGANRVVAINLAIGDRAGVAEESVLFYFDQLSPGTLAEGARLNVRHVAARYYCTTCEVYFLPQEGDERCPECGCHGRPSHEGRDLRVESIEIE